MQSKVQTQIIFKQPTLVTKQEEYESFICYRSRTLLSSFTTSGIWTVGIGGASFDLSHTPDQTLKSSSENARNLHP